MKELIFSKQALRTILSILVRIFLIIKFLWIIIGYIYIITVLSNNSLVIYDYILLSIIGIIFIISLLINNYSEMINKKSFRKVLLFILVPVISLLLLLNEKRIKAQIDDIIISNWTKSILIMQYAAMILYLPFIWIKYLIIEYYYDIMFLSQSFDPNGLLDVIFISLIFAFVLIWPFTTFTLIVISIVKTHQKKYNDVILINLLAGLTSIYISFHVPILLANTYSIKKSSEVK